MKRIYLIFVLFAMTMVSCVPEAEKATVEIKEFTDVTLNSVRVVCNVSDDGGAEVSSRGVCWDTSESPTIETASSMGAGSGIGNYECEISGLESGTTYYVRAYATNSAGISYGEQKEFTTLGDNNGGDDDNDDDNGGGNGGDDDDDDDNGGGNGDDDDEPTTGTINGHEWVDLGLPSGLKWATCNVGASSPEDYGNYYAWGETTTKSTYTEDNSLTYGLNESQLQSQGYIDGSGNLTPSHDAATANWGGSWRMPTEDEMQELVDYCEWEWTQVNGVNGSKVIGPNGSCIFLPAAGRRYGTSLSLDGSNGYCWSSTPYGSYDYYYDYDAYYLNFNDGYENVDWSYGRHDGLTVRPITE